MCSLIAAAAVILTSVVAGDAAALAPKQPHSQHCYEFPLVILSTVNRAFPDPTCNQLRYPAPDCLKEKVETRVEVIDHADGSLNCYGAEPTTVYEDVESNYRGQTSLFFPKHQMNVKFKNETNFVGLPEDKAFILNGPYLDCSLLRNHMAHWLFRSTGRYSPRTKHVVLYIRESPDQTEARYAGIYLLLEKLSYGPNRVNLAKLDTKCKDVTDLTGGWAWQNDPLSYGSYSPNVVIDQYQNEFGMGERPILAYPDGGELSQKIRDYFVNTSTGFLPQMYRFLWNNMTNNPDALETHLDLGSFADYILHTEMSLNVDAYRRSTFFFKDRAQTINAGPVWDLNLAYGNGARHNFKDWIFPQYTYWKRLMCNYKLTSLVIQRWKQLRSDGGAWSDKAISDFLDAGAAPVRRQLQKCKGEWRSDVVQCAYVSLKDCNGTYEERVESLKQAVLDRSHWMDAHITKLYKPLNATTCSGVGEIPKYNCARDGNDDGCLQEPEKYYSAVAFPRVRTPYTGPSCATKFAASLDGTAQYKRVPADEQMSGDDCWKSAGLYVYPQQKGVRERNLTHFCNGYGTCAQGPGAKCDCRKGILLQQHSCRRIDAESEKYMPVESASASVSKQFAAADAAIESESVWTQHKLFLALGGMLLVASVFVVVTKAKERARHERLNVYRPVQYGSVEDYRTFTSPPRAL
uniref:Spore coat protein CotH n=1 Tax=Globisporangium ultimum (strain ATCC 200006 / CBS 805.95 / DAOM BR144) TaxID=431595 RepID=K3X2P1_GLOUD